MSVFGMPYGTASTGSPLSVAVEVTLRPEASQLRVMATSELM